jgi:hypothetical protein
VGDGVLRFGTLSWLPKCPEKEIAPLTGRAALHFFRFLLIFFYYFKQNNSERKAIRKVYYVTDLRYLWEAYNHREFGEPCEKSYPPYLEAESEEDKDRGGRNNHYTEDLYPLPEE